MYKVEITGVDTSKLVALKNEEIIDLIKEYQNGNLKAREKLIEGNLKLVLSVIKSFNKRKENVDDLFQVGCIGLMKSIDHFDLSHNVKFSTYAVPMIIGEIRRYLRDSGSIRVSRAYKDIAYKALNFKEKYYQANHKEPTIDEIASGISSDPIDLVLALEAMQDTVSMSSPIYDNGGDIIELSDQIGFDEMILEKWAQKHMLKNAYLKLNDREKEIIFKRYFLDKTQNEIASELDISQAQVSRIEKSALKSMHDDMK